ncbi:MAG: UDP-glucose/GDP-mannose dehydrogenase family protein [Pseudomonadota bacterium]
MKILVIGTGYVGLVTGACLSDFGLNVVCVDNDEQKINLLKNNVISIYEPGLQEIVERNQNVNLLHFSHDINEHIEQSDVIFLAVGTPTDDNTGNADLTYIFAAVANIAKYIKNDCVVIVKSTVPVGTGQKIKQFFLNNVPNYNINVVSNPEFLREGSAVADFMQPDRIIIGTNSGQAREIMRKLYWNMIDRDVPIIFTDVKTAEFSKYASNAFLATKITFVNEMADICENVEANINDVTKIMGLDQRIGQQYLKVGPGFGGSCFPKDTLALNYIANNNAANSKILEAVIKANDARKAGLGKKVMDILGDSANSKKIAILGTAFKGNTDDMRYSPAIDLINYLLDNRRLLNIYDPAAIANAQEIWPDNSLINWCESIEQSLQAADAAVIITEWLEFSQINWLKDKDLMTTPILIDFRNLYDPKILEKIGVEYHSLGR